MVRRASPPPTAGGLRVMDDPAQVAAALSPVRRRLLAELEREPDSAAVGSRGASTLPASGSPPPARARARAASSSSTRSASAAAASRRAPARLRAAFVIDPALLGSLGADPAAIQDRFSSHYQIAHRDEAPARPLRAAARCQRARKALRR
jgi:hypothetical protein